MTTATARLQGQHGKARARRWRGAGLFALTGFRALAWVPAAPSTRRRTAPFPPSRVQPREEQPGCLAVIIRRWDRPRLSWEFTGGVGERGSSVGAVFPSGVAANPWLPAATSCVCRLAWPGAEACACTGAAPACSSRGTCRGPRAKPHTHKLKPLLSSQQPSGQTSSSPVSAGGQMCSSPGEKLQREAGWGQVRHRMCVPGHRRREPSPTVSGKCPDPLRAGFGTGGGGQDRRHRAGLGGAA